MTGAGIINNEQDIFQVFQHFLIHMPAITVQQLTKRFGDFTAVDEVSLEIPEGEIFGFLGSNGAGKSTLIRMLCGILEPTSGTGTVGGYSIIKEPEQVKSSIGYMSQRFSLYNDLTVEENITFFGGAYGISRTALPQRKDWALETSHLREHSKTLVKNLSVGWKQRLALVCALLHQPRIIFLDEPTSGVDPITRRQFWDLIRVFAAQGVTVFLTTHFLDEAEQCMSIGLIHKGRLIARGTVDELKTHYMTNPIYELVCNNPVEAMEYAEKLDEVIDSSIFGMNVHIMTKTGAEIPEFIKKSLHSAGITVQSLEPIEPSLEDVFIHLIEGQFTVSEL